MENNSMEQNNIINSSQNNQKNKGNGVFIVVIIFLILIILGLGGYILCDKLDINLEKDNSTNNSIKEDEKLTSNYKMSGNSLETFDLEFLKLENGQKNMVYSPLSIKYTLAMLKEGSNGTTKAQLDSIIGDYKSSKYINSSNMSFANAMFINNIYKDSIKSTYTNNLKDKYNAEVIYDPFKNSSTVNNWVSNKTFGLINNLVDDISNSNFVLVNGLAIDMEWTNVIQAAAGIPYDKEKTSFFEVKYNHENFMTNIIPIEVDNYESVDFGSNHKKAKAVEVGAVLNNYDIINDLGEENIKQNIAAKYREWAKDGNPCSGEMETDESVNAFVNKYVEELSTNYKDVSVSSDFSIYNDDNLKMFAKDLKEYDGVTLEYIGIMPKKDNLDTFIKNNNASDIINLISKLKTLELNNFTNGKITHITGLIPLFNFDYELDLQNNLKKMGIINVFDASKADLSNLTSTKGTYIDQAKHKASIEFSNEGIKAAAATSGGGMGDASCGFEYLYEVPVEKIDITFDKPYMFIIRNKKTGEVWFSGKVYEPTENNK